MNQKLSEIYDIIESAIDEAIFNQKFNLKLYDYLKSNKLTKDELNEILNSSSIYSVKTTSIDLTEYIEGGSDNNHKQLREAYGYLSKPIARKVVNYLDNIIEDVVKYKNQKGKRTKQSKSK